MTYDNASLAGYLRAAEKRVDTKDHFFFVYRLDHIIIGPRQKTFPLIRGCFPRSYHKDGNITPVVTKHSGELYAVDSGHHDVQHDEVDLLFVHHGKRLFAIGRRNRVVAVLHKNRFHQATVSGAVAYAVSTLYRLEVRKEILVAVLLPFLLLPEHIAYSFTMWKDIPFSASVLYFIVSVFRFINQLYFSKKFNLTMVILSSIGICMFRGNGLIVFFIMLLFFYTLFRKKYRELLISFSCVMLLALFVTFPVCKMLGYQQSDSVELLSVPIQQIARTVSENDDISQSQIELVSNVVNEW